MLLIAIAGGSGSGKTTLARKLAAALGTDRVLILSQDSYYIDQSSRFDGDGGSVNFDHPSALDFRLLAQHLAQLKSGKDVEVPIYDFATHKRSARTERATPHPVILVDGTLVLGQDDVIAHCDHKIFLEVPEKVRFERRLKRDTVERGREHEGVKRQFVNQVIPMHDQFVQPSAARADWTYHHGEDLDEWVLNFARTLKADAK